MQCEERREKREEQRAESEECNLEPESQMMSNVRCQM